MTRNTFVIAGILFLIFACDNHESVKNKNENLIIGSWVIDSIRTANRTIRIGTFSCLLGKPGFRRYLEFYSDNTAKHIKKDLGTSRSFEFRIENDTLLSYLNEAIPNNVKTICYLDSTKLILSDTAKIDGCLFRRPAFPGDTSWPFEKVYYFYHRE